MVIQSLNFSANPPTKSNQEIQQEESIRSSSSSSTDPYADNQVHHCTYCGKEFRGPGYIHPGGQCIKQEQDAGMGDIYTCTLKCCIESQ